MPPNSIPDRFPSVYSKRPQDRMLPSPWNSGNMVCPWAQRPKASQGPFGLSSVSTIRVWWQEMAFLQPVGTGSVDRTMLGLCGLEALQRGHRGSTLCIYWMVLSFVAWSLGDVRSWEPVQPELPQELGDPAPRTSLLALHSRGLYKAQTGAPCGPSGGRGLPQGGTSARCSASVRRVQEAGRLIPEGQGFWLPGHLPSSGQEGLRAAGDL